MAPSRRQSNGRSPLVNQQRQITSFFSKSTSSPSSIPSKQKPNSSSISEPKPSSSPSLSTPSPCYPKRSKPLLVIGASSPVSSPESVSLDKQSDGEDVVGRRIKVYWPLDNAWYEGCVKSFDKATGKHLIHYDDDEEELLELAKEKIEWVRDSVKKLKRLRRGFSPPKRMIMEDDELAENVDEESGGVDDDSNDEDWGKNASEVFEDAEDRDEDLELDEEEDEEDMAKSSKGKPKVKSGKRKVSVIEKLGSAKKSKTGGEAVKESFNISKLKPKSNWEIEKQSIGIDDVAATREGNQRFASREAAQKFRFLRE